MTDDLPTADSTSPVLPTAPVSPAQVTPTMTASLATLSAPPSAADVSAMLNAERRIRDLQATADRTRAEADKVAAEREALARELQTLKDMQKTVMDGAAQAAQQALDRANALAADIERERGERMKAEALLLNPGLAPYAQFIPATTDAIKLQEHIATFQAARTKDLEAQKAAAEQQQPQAQTPSVLSLYPPGYVPSANPARPAPSAPGQGSIAEQIQAKLEAARASGDPQAFNQAVKEAAAMAESHIQQTIGYHPQRP